MADLSVRQIADLVEPASRRGTDGAANHARASRAQAGRALLDRPTVLRWLDVTDADEAARERVLALLQAAHAETVKWSDALADEDTGHLQDVAARRERSATMIASYEQAYLPGLTQTSAYARALMPHFRIEQDIAAAVAARMRRQELLHEPGRTFQFVITRRALAWRPGPDVSMSGQWDRLIELDRLPNVEIRVLEDDASVLGGMSSFNMYVGGDEVLVAIELDAGEKIYGADGEDDDSARRYQERFDELFVAARSIADVSPVRNGKAKHE